MGTTIDFCNTFSHLFSRGACQVDTRGQSKVKVSCSIPCGARVDSLYVSDDVARGTPDRVPYIPITRRMQSPTLFPSPLMHACGQTLPVSLSPSFQTVRGEQHEQVGQPARPRPPSSMRCFAPAAAAEMTGRCQWLGGKRGPSPCLPPSLLPRCDVGQNFKQTQSPAIGSGI